MVDPRPIRLTQIDEADYKSELDPAPFVVVGPIPGGAGDGVQSIVAGTNVTVDDSDPQNPVISATGGGGGGGAVDSVNGQTGVVTLDLQDVVGDQAIVTGVIGVADNAASPTQATVIQSADTTVRNLTTGDATSIAPGEVFFTKGANRGAIQAPSSGGTATVLTIPPTSGTIALAADVDNVFQIATDAETLATNAVPNTRTVAGKPLSANVSLDKNDVGLSNVDNISAANMPISSAQQTALNLKANSADVVPNTRTVAGKALSANITLAKADVGLGNVDNTTDANKPVSTAQATAINAKVGSPNSTITGLAYYPTVASLPATGTAGVIYYVDAV